MKRLIFNRTVEAMGYKNPAKRVPAHNTYNASLDISKFKDLVDIANQSGNVNLIDGLIQLVIDDINTDNNAGNVANINIRKYYKPYYDIISKSQLANTRLLQQLQNLV